MAAITPTQGHYYLVKQAGQLPSTWELVLMITGNDGQTYYQVINGQGAILWYNASQLPDGFALVYDFGTTAPAYFI